MDLIYKTDITGDFSDRKVERDSGYTRQPEQRYAMRSARKEYSSCKAFLISFVAKAMIQRRTFQWILNHEPPTSAASEG